MVVSGIATVWLPVTDLDRAVGFYRDALGLDVAEQQSEWAELKADGLTIGLNARSEETPSGDGGAVVAFRVDDDIEAAAGQLRDKGVDLAGEVSEHPWGKVVTFADPDGNDLQLYQPPA